MSHHSRETNAAIIAMQHSARRITSLTIRLSVALGASNQTEIDNTASALVAESGNLTADVKHAISILPSTRELDAAVSFGGTGWH